MSLRVSLRLKAKIDLGKKFLFEEEEENHETKMVLLTIAYKILTQWAVSKKTALL